MTMFTKCILCNAKINLFYEDKNKNNNYYKCENCSSVMLDPSNYLSGKDEEERYKIHNNDVNDINYQNFVAPIVEGVRQKYNTNHIGLDYGAGPGPVVTSLLEKEGYNIKLYDPFFYDYSENIKGKYDYIICSEVIEHFHKPYDEFKKLFNLLNAKGSIFCMTSLYNIDINFNDWYYKNDETHVFFYHKQALEWIKSEFNFSQLVIEGQLIKFIK